MKFSLPQIVLMTLCCYSWVFVAARSEGDEPIELISTINVPGNLIDKSGLQQELQPGIWHDVFGGISALEYTGRENLYVALPDRGPKDGAIDYSCRFHLVRIEPQASSDQFSKFSIESTVLMSDALTRRFTGSSTLYESTENENRRLDPEGVRKDADGNYWISDEYGPHVMQFSGDGTLLREFDVPPSFAISKPGPDKKTENANNQSGRAGNRGMEGLAISNDGKVLYGLMQSPLLQDCRRNEKGKPIGVNCRLLRMNLANASSSEFLYVMDDPKNKLNEILSFGDQFLVIERDGNVGSEAKFKKIMKIDAKNATAIEDLERLPAEGTPNDVVALKKEVFIDLLDPKFGLTGDEMPEKIESLTFGPDLADGRKLLLVASDNDFNKDWPTKIYCFAIGAAKEKNQTVTSR